VKLIIASEADLNAYVDQIDRLRDTSPSGISRATQEMAELEGGLTDKSVRGTNRALRHLAAVNQLTDNSVGGQQRAIDVIESADPYGLRTTLPAHVEDLARLKDTSIGGIQGATALIRVRELREDLTDKTVRGHNRAIDAIQSTPPVAVEIEPKAAPVVEQVAEQVAQKTEGLLDQIASQLARARDAVSGWIKSAIG
jgi:hypothetical protein